MEALLADDVRTIAERGGEFAAAARRRAGPGQGGAAASAPERRGGAGIASRACGRSTACRRWSSSLGCTPRAKRPARVLRCDVDADGRIIALHSILASRKLTAVRFP